jgi:hypothetical protein
MEDVRGGVAEELYCRLRPRRICNLEIERERIFDLCPIDIERPAIAPKFNIDEALSYMRTLDRFTRIPVDLLSAISF